jgi:hypothetical protein
MEGGDLIESRFVPRTFDFDTMLNYQLSHKFKLIRRNKFNHLIISLIRFLLALIHMVWQDTEQQEIYNIIEN